MDILSNWYLAISLLLLRYLLIAGIAYLIFYVIKKEAIKYKKIQIEFPSNSDIIREIKYSILTLLIFSLIPFIIFNTNLKNYTLVYEDIEKYGLFWFSIAFLVMLLLHDMYFYFMHRLMHYPKIFKYVHRLHHKSINPSPWAALAFHPFEAIIETGIVFILFFCIPLTFYHFLFFYFFMMLYNVYGHLGWEIFPKNFNKSLIGKWINTSINHNQHHQFFKGNYGLYFLWWDRWLNTLNENYDSHYDEIQNREF